MSALLTPELTDVEYKQALDDLLERKRREWSFFTQVITEADNFYGTMLHNAFIERDWFRFGEVIDQIERQFFNQCGYDQEAYLEAKNLKYISRVTKDPE